MLNALRNFWTSKKEKESSETMVPGIMSKNSDAIFKSFKPEQNNNFNNIPKGRDSKYIVTEEAWDNNIAWYKKVGFGPVYDMNKYKAPLILGDVAEKVKEEFSKNVKSDTVKFIELEESKDEDTFVFPTVKLLHSGKEVSLKDLLDVDSCKKHNIRSVTLCHPNENKTKGIRLFIRDDGARMYEAADGSYEMNLTWYVEGKECKIKVLVHSDKPVELIERNGVTDEQLRANTEVILGPQGKAKSLYKALTPQLQQTKIPEHSQLKGSETIGNFVAENPEAKPMLEALGSQLQQTSPKADTVTINTASISPSEVSETVDQLGGPSTDLREVKNALLLKKGLISERTLSQLG